MKKTTMISLSFQKYKHPKQIEGKTENKNKTKIKQTQIKFSSFRPALSVCASPDTRFHRSRHQTFHLIPVCNNPDVNTDLQITTVILSQVWHTVSTEADIEQFTLNLPAAFQIPKQIFHDCNATTSDRRSGCAPGLH